MERIRRLGQFWNWLPAFRVVAETQHLPTAARELRLTAPALSRSIKLLERHLEVQLFRRSGRNIVLTDAGQRFLASLREGMRLIHEGVGDLDESNLRGEVFVLSSGLITTFLIDALAELRREHPGLQPVVTSESPDEVPERLLRGELDLALHSVAVPPGRLQSEHLGQATSGVYCGPGHPLYEPGPAATVATAELLEYAFVGPTSGDFDDGWPPDLSRRIAMRVSHMHLGCDICAQGDLLAILPDVVARAYGGGRVLRRLPLELPAPTQLFATHRPTLDKPGKAEVVLAAVRECIRRVGGTG